MFRMGVERIITWNAGSIVFALLVLTTGPAQASHLPDSLLRSASNAIQRGDLSMADPMLASAYALASSARDSALQANILMQQGLSAHIKGDLVTTMDLYLRAQRLRESLGDQAGLAETYNSIGSIHHLAQDHAKARAYYVRSLAIREELGHDQQVAMLHNNLGSLSEEMGLPDSALIHYQRSLMYWERTGNISWQAVVQGNIGVCYMAMGKVDTARSHLQRAVDLLPTEPRTRLLGTTYCEMGRVLLAGHRPLEALGWCEKAMSIARALDQLPLKEKCSHCLYETNEALGNRTVALEFFKDWIGYRDSLYDGERMQALTRMEMSHSFAERQLVDSLRTARERMLAENTYREGLRRERDQKRFFLVIGAAVLLLAGGLWNRLIYVRRSRNVIQRERDRSDGLLLNILPREVAQELKNKGQAEAKRFEEVSILFTDFKDFTAVSERMSPEELVEELNTCFKAFDGILSRHGVEKIKTIGDAYMGAGGIPTPSPDSALRTVLAALEMQAFMNAHTADRLAMGKPAFAMRAGIHTGPVVAGVVGERKFQYDLWGDTVNTASRLETAGEPGLVNISGSTHARLAGTPGLHFTPRGRVPVKGKGELEMYFVRSQEQGLAMDPSTDKAGRSPVA